MTQFEYMSSNVECEIYSIESIKRAETGLIHLFYAIFSLYLQR